MTITTSQYFTDWLNADGVNKNWSYGFPIRAAEDIYIQYRDPDGLITETQLNLMWYPTNDDEGYVQYPNTGVALAAGYSVRIVRRLPYTQEAEIGNEGSFRPEIHEAAFDRATQQIQQLAGETLRAVKVPLGFTAPSMDIIPEDHYYLMGPNNRIMDGGPGSAIRGAQEQAGAVAAALAEVQNLTAQVLQAASAIATAPQWAFNNKADLLAYFEPITAPKFITIGGYLYFYAATEPAHSGKAQDKAGNWYVVAPRLDGKYSADALGLCDGADSADRILELVEAGIRYIDVPLGYTMTVDTPAILNTDEDISFSGRGTIDCSTYAARIEINGSYRLLPALSADAVAGDLTLKFTAPHGLAYNDRVAVEDTRAYSGGLARYYYHNGFNAIVAEVISDTQVKIFGRVPVTVSKTYAEVGELPGGMALIQDNLNIIPNTSDYAPILIRRRRGVRIEAPKTPVGSGYTNMTVNQCYDIIARDIRGNIDMGPLGTSDAYPITFNSCHKAILENIIATFSPRHGVAIGGGGVMADNHGNVPTRSMHMLNCILESSGTVGAGDMHGGVFDSEYIDCTFNPNCGLAGGNNRLVNPVIHATDGRCIRMTELFGGTIEIINPKFIVYEANDVEGVVFLLTNMLSVDTNIIIRNATIENRGPANVTLRPLWVNASAINWDASTGAYPTGLAEKNSYIVTVAGTVDGILRNVGEVWIYPGASYMVPGTSGTLIKSTQPKVNVSLLGETRIINADNSYMITLAGLLDMSSRFTASIESVRGGSGRYMVYSSPANAAACKVKLPKQTLRYSGTTPTASQDLIPALQTFPWEYPKKPNARASWWTNADTLILSGFADIYCNVGRLTTTAAQPYLRKASGPWSAANDLGIAVEAWLDEL